MTREERDMRWGTPHTVLELPWGDLKVVNGKIYEKYRIKEYRMGSCGEWCKVLNEWREIGTARVKD